MEILTVYHICLPNTFHLAQSFLYLNSTINPETLRQYWKQNEASTVSKYWSFLGWQGIYYNKLFPKTKAQVSSHLTKPQCYYERIHITAVYQMLTLFIVWSLFNLPFSPTYSTVYSTVCQELEMNVFGVEILYPFLVLITNWFSIIQGCLFFTRWRLYNLCISEYLLTI